MPYSFPDRYNKNGAKKYDLLNYVRDCQIYYDEDIRSRCHKILDFLYSVVPNDKENAVNYLQIQKMDLRSAQVVRVDDTTIALVPTVTGEAEKITIENEKQRQPEKTIESLISDCNKKLSENEFRLKDCLEAIELLLETRKNCIVPEVYDKVLIAFLIMALNDNALDDDTKSRYCQIWIDGIKSYFSNQSFIFDYNYSWVLFAQIETNVRTSIKVQIRQLLLDLILYNGQNGIVAEIALYAKQYLAANKQLAKSVFNTIVKLAEDEMNHQKFNADYLKKYRRKENFKFSPNAQPKLSGVDFYIKEDKRKKYKSQKDEIIKEYLINKTMLDLTNFDMDNYDITTLCYAINCGLSLNDTIFTVIVKKFVRAMINVWYVNRSTHDSHKILGVYPIYEVVNFFQRELVASEIQTSIVLDILFTGVDFSIFTSETLEFYLDVFGSLLSEYFDSHSNKDRRAYFEKIICSLECKIMEVNEEKIKIELYKSLILSVTRYGGGGDWSKCPSGYSYQDKHFLNVFFSTYGGFHLKEMLDTIYKLHLDKLLPEILLSVRDAFKNALKINMSSSDKFAEIIREKKAIVMTMITKTYLDFSDQIKQDDDLTKAFEEILEMLVEKNYEEAATILDEFRVH